MHRMRLVVLGIAILAMLSLWGSGVFVPLLRPMPQGNRPASESGPRYPTPISIAAPHLDAADAKIAKALEDGFPAISIVFKRASTHVDAYSKKALGFSSKWRLIADAMPYASGDRHQQFLRDEFERLLFSQNELESAIRQTINGFLQEVRSVEGRMLVDIQADIADFPEHYEIATLDRETVEARFNAAIEDAMRIAGSDLRANIGTQLTSLVAGEVLTQVAVRLGVSVGILGTGAASGWATLGVGVIVGIIIDQIISWIWDQWSNPREQLAQHIQHHLDVLQALICFGDDEVQGLRQQLRDIAILRSQARREAVLSLLDAGPHRPLSPKDLSPKELHR